MSPRDSAVTRAAIRTLIAAVALSLVAAWCPVAEAQQVAALANRSVGGVLVDVNGMLTNASLDQFGELRKVWLGFLGDIPNGLDRASEMRKVSLRRLDEAIRQCRESGQPLSAEMECLGGLQRVHYVLVYPEQHDIVLVGPAEGWKVNQRGAVVGVTTGRPVMLLDDLLVALRAASGPVRRVTTCSIDPTPEGLQRLNMLRGKIRPGADPQATAMGFEQQLGPQKISVTGVPDTSHFARVMVAADYRMKRIGLGAEQAPVRGLPGFMELMGSRGTRNMMPRWWLAPDYDPLLRDADGLAWEIRGASVKTMTESGYLDAAGDRRQGDRAADSFSEKWAQLMTERYDDLALADPVFGQLQNCMDLAIVGALVAKENLLAKAQVQLPMLMDTSGLETAEFPTPKHADSKSTLAKKGSKWLIACGGVEINPWAIVDKTEQSDALASVRSQAAPQADLTRWWD